MSAVRNPAALAAYIGRKKYGAKKFAQMSAAGRKRKGGGSRFRALVAELHSRHVKGK